MSDFSKVASADWCAASFGSTVASVYDNSIVTRRWMCRLEKGHEGEHDCPALRDGVGLPTGYTLYEPEPSEEEVAAAIDSIVNAGKTKD